MVDLPEISIGNDRAVGCLPFTGFTVLIWVNAFGRRFRQWFPQADGVAPKTNDNPG